MHDDIEVKDENAGLDTEADDKVHLKSTGLDNKPTRSLMNQLEMAKPYNLEMVMSPHYLRQISSLACKRDKTVGPTTTICNHVEKYTQTGGTMPYISILP